MTPPELALVVPCYNEAARLDPEAFLRFASTHPTVQLLFVDDGSVDKGEAVRAGILAATTRRASIVGSSLQGH